MLSLRAKTVAAAIAVGCGPQTAVRSGGPIVPHDAATATTIRVSRTDGVAPLAVFFEATGGGAADLSADMFKNALFVWDFGDPGAGTWVHTGGAKNKAHGAVAAHVYTAAGQYTATLTVTADGHVTRQSVRITVTDPQRAYAGTGTVCVSARGDFTGCPPGARRITTRDLDVDDSGALAYLDRPNRRVLLRRGDTFLGDKQSSLCGAGPRHLGAYGAGDAPRLLSAYENGHFIVLGCIREATDMNDWRITDLDLDGQGRGRRAFRERQVRNLLLARLHVHDFNAQNINMDIHHAGEGQGGGHAPDAVFFVELRVHDARSNQNMYIGGRRIAVLGSHLYGPGTHSLRTPFVDRAVFQHNLLAGAGSRAHLLKIANSTATSDFRVVSKSEATRRLIVSDNVLIGGDEAEMVGFGPQGNSQSYPENVTEIIMERNTIRASDSTRLAIRLNANHMVIRNNVFVLKRGRAIHIKKRSSGQPPPDGNEIYHNTVIWTGQPSPCSLVLLSKGDNPGDPFPNRTIVRNNLVYLPQPLQAPIIEDQGAKHGTVTVREGNTSVVGRPPFTAPVPLKVDELVPPVGSGAVDAAAPMRFSYEDRRGYRRHDRRPDIGALERGARN